jgi:hypothetical protein
MPLSSVNFKGLDPLNDAFKAAGKDAPIYGQQALFEEAQEAFRLSQEVVPVDTGVLRASGNVTQYRTGNIAHAWIRYGGAASSYAIYVHEIPPNSGGRWGTGNKHASPTQWKFLENPVKLYSKGMAQRMRVRVFDMIHRRFAI